MATVGTGRRARARRVAAAGTLLAALLTAGLAAGCTASNGPGDDGRGSPRTSHPAETDGARAPVLAVKIDNAPAARPQTGLESADVVYVEQVEGGLSRLMAVYATRLPESVGPVRSVREADLELLRQFDRPVLAFSGAQGRLLPLIDRAPLEPLTPETSGTEAGVYVRGTTRPAPHNLFLRPGPLMDGPPGRASLTTGFRTGPPPPGGEPVSTRTVRYPAARFTFDWSGARDRWLVSMDGTPATTTEGEPVAPATVVVQYVTVRPSDYHDSRGNNTPYTETVGSGRATVLRDGRAHDVRWSRPDASAGTAFTTDDGTAVNFARGQVWVVYAEAA
ncbi:DUF3048 domain-containing protein [Streptomyces sp. MAR25Y5]|uniref:DUF3048 domain-containing protein n=1 Tax=Streptomyces sp. MAR25Y5 TaxID=2962028 RepID=UPI0020B799B9|nr:DUF3048 domain-containing protein [Streptomyces sp. MAR25Y5]MCP3767769.1 DUF3048 domain-containing protein [Streptomyces sp. MAR25Y5]